MKSALSLRVLCGAALFVLSGATEVLGQERPLPDRLPLNDPAQITAEAEGVADPVVSPDGRWLVYAAGPLGSRDLWLRSADPNVVVLPRRLTSAPGDEDAPAFSPDGRRLAYVGRSYDARGDLFVLELGSEGRTAREPVRLTGREGAEGAPAFGPDGETLYFHRTHAGSSEAQLSTLDLGGGRPAAPRNLSAGEGTSPVPSPDHRWLAFVSHREDSGGDLYLLDLRDGRVETLTSGPALDSQPAWGTEGTLVFSRRDLDTDGDGWVTPRDRAVLVRIRVDEAGERSVHPLTSAVEDAERPTLPADGAHLFYLSPRAGTPNVWSLPGDGIVPSMPEPAEQIALADAVTRRVPRHPLLEVLAYERVLERFPASEPVAARAAYAVGRSYQEANQVFAAEEAYRRAAEGHDGVEPTATLARLREIGLRTFREAGAAVAPRERQAILDRGLRQLEALGEGPHFRSVGARAGVERARLLLEVGRDPDALLAAVATAEEVARRFSDFQEEAAEALFLRAEAFARVGQFDNVETAYLAVLEGYPGVETWADRAVSRLLDLASTTTGAEGLEPRLQVLRSVARANRDELPRLAMGALNRVGDLLYAAGEWARAKSAYRQVLEEFPGATTQGAAARLSLAEILYREERFRQALDLYESELKVRPGEDRIYRLARRGYIHRSVEAGEFLFRTGEVVSARSLFRDLLRYDDSVVEAHRGYIKAAAALGDLEPVLDEYREQAQHAPGNAVVLYAVGLCLTYRDTRSALEEARDWITRAIVRRGQVEYFHQTLGYVFEVLETVHGEKGNLERALESYQKAFFLNDAAENSTNAANLLLNLGNVNFLLGQNRAALGYYKERLATDQPFENPDTEILFYRRFGAAAFQVGEPGQTVELYERALALVEQRTDPLAASRAFDALIRTVLDRVLATLPPPLARSAESEAFAKRESGIRASLFDLTDAGVGTIPSPAWEAYRSGVAALVAEQETLNRGLASFVGRSDASEGDRVREALALQTRRVQEGLDAPERFVQLRAELLDRLGLARQEAGQWEGAAQTFRDAFELNERLGNDRNLALNRRGTAFNLYQLAGATSGEERVRLLEEASQGFREVMDLVRRYGVPTRKEEGGGALIAIRVEVPLDERAATQAAYGFTAEQEERLAEAFLARIDLELGRLGDAEKNLETQLARYPKAASVSPEDRFGVSLLHHRAGLLAFARGRAVEAAESFQRSADMTHELGSAASTALNVANLARAVTSVGSRDPSRPSLVRAVGTEDRRAGALLRQDPLVARQGVALFYHEALGLFWLGEGTGMPEISAEGVACLERASAHFLAGIEALEPDEAVAGDRESLARTARLQLGLSRTLEALGLPAGEHWESARIASERGLLPDLTWRALVGLGRAEEALDALESVPILRAYAAPGEIQAAFAPLFEKLIQSGDPEAAFDLGERLSELARVHRLAPLFVGPLTEGERDVARKALPRLLRIRELRGAAERAEGEERTYLSENLEREQELLDGLLGKGRERVPALAAMERRAELQDAVIVLLGLAVASEEAADAAVRASAREDGEAFRQKSLDLLARYEDELAEARVLRGEGDPPGILALLGPEPAAAVDVMEHLPEHGRLVRTWRRPSGGFWVFQVGPDLFGVESVESLADLQVPEGAVLASEEIGGLEGTDLGGTVRALSATHWLRSFSSRKPFRRVLLSVGTESLPSTPGYEVENLTPETSAAAFRAAAPEAHTLLLSGLVRLRTGVPTRAGETAPVALALDLPGGRSLRLVEILGHLPRASVALLPQVHPEAAYAAAQLFSVAGCPTVLLGEASAAAPSVPALLGAYARGTAAGAAAEVGGWEVFGFGGLDDEEARAFAEERFFGYVREAQAAFQGGHPLDALLTAEDALLVVDESEELSRYRVDLQRFAREAAWNAGSLGAAERHAADLAALMGERNPDSEGHAEALLRLGLIQARREEYDRAVPNLEAAVAMMEALELGTEAARALAGLGIVLEDATEYDRALVTFQSAAEVSREMGQEEILAAQYANIGRLYDLRLSRWAMAKQSYLRALELADATGDLPGVIQALVDVGRCERLLGNFPAAEERYALATELLEEEPDPVLRAKVVIERANNAWFQGAYQEAFDLQREARALSREQGWDLGQVLALNTSGLTWWTLGDHDRALRELQQALDLARTLDRREDEVATALNNIGLVYREMGRYEEARETLERALAIDRRLKSRWAVAYDLRNLGLTHLRQGNLEQALQLLGQAAAEAGTIGDRVNEAKALLALGEAHTAIGGEGDRAEAREAYRRALDLARGMFLREVEWRALHGLALLARSEGDREAARDLLTEAVEVVEGMRAAIKLEQLRDGFLADKMAVYEALVGVLVEEGKAAAAFEVAERSRSRNFIDLLGNQRLSLRDVVDRQLYERELTLKARTEEQRALLAGADTEEERAAYREALQQLADQHRDLLLEIQARNPELASLVSVQPLGAPEVRAILEPGVALLAYYLLETEVLCWVVRPEGVELLRIPANRERLGEAVFDYRRLIQNLEPLEGPSRDLYDLLVAPALPHLQGVSRLGIIPHGALHYLSFATLAGERDYVADAFPLFYLPSASVLEYTRGRRAAGVNRKVLAIGNPALGTAALELPFAEQEVGTIRWNFPDVTVLTGERATESWVTEHLGDFGIIHLASHGEFDPINPLFSALKLTRDLQADGDLEAKEVFGLEINADLVVLSACQTGLGKVTRGDDVIGLNRAFFYAGTHTILSSLWRVSDVSTAILMKQFYRQYSGHNKAESLRAATLHVKNRYPHPGYWGAFVLAGDWE